MDDLEQDLDIDFKALLIDTPGYVFVKDLNSIYRWCNKNGALLYGVGPPKNIVGKSDYDCHQKNADKFVENDQMVIRTGQVHVSERDIITTPEGKTLIIRSEKKPLYNRKGQLVGILGTGVDITNTIKAERLELENSLQRNKIEQQATFKKAIDQIVHDIRSPLASLMMVAQTCTHIPESTRIILRETSNSINVIAESLLQVWCRDKKDDSHEELSSENPEPVIVALAVLQVLTSKRYQYKNSKLTFSHTFTANSYFTTIQVDLSCFARMLSNLINNAVEAYDERQPGNIHLTVEANSETVTITVADQGKGIRPEVLDKINQGISITADKLQGCGIGLGQIKDTIIQYRGTFELNSRVGEGTDAVIRFPLIRTPEWLATSIEWRSDDMMIILDDDASIHAAWDKCLEAYSLNVIHFSQGQDAIHYIQNSTNKDGLFLLADYELLEQRYNGLQVIEISGIQRSALVTSRYDNVAVRNKAIALKTKILPKQLALEACVNIVKNHTQAPCPAHLSHVDVVVVDDDEKISPM